MNVDRRLLNYGIAADPFEDEIFVRTKPVELKKALMDLDSFMSQSQKSGNSKEDEDDYTEITGTEITDCSETTLGGSLHSQSSLHRHLLRVVSDASADEAENQSTSFKTLQTHRILGEGYFGQVYLVSADEDHVFALKKISKYHVLVEGQVDSVKNEKQILSKLRHPNIVRLHGTWQDEHSLYFLQTFCPGGELFTLMHQTFGQKLPEPSCRFYTACIVDALWYMHCHSIVYRDLKPENVLIDERGYPILVDFGYAKELTDDEALSYTLCGTPKYVPPEMIKGTAHTFTVDYWSMGVILYELLSHEHPFEFYDNMDDLSLYASIAEADYLELPEDVSDSARDIVDKLLVKKPAKRLGTKESRTGNELLEHRWLKCVDLESLRRKLVPAPWIPTLSGPLDTRHFEVIEGPGDSYGDDDAKLTAREQAQFSDF